MGFITTATTITLLAKLTPLGRVKLVKTNNNLVSTFVLGDSDANYTTSLPLPTGYVPSISGNMGVNNAVVNSTASNISINSKLYITPTTGFKKPIETTSSDLTTEVIINGSITSSGSSLTQFSVNRQNINTDPLVNLFSSFRLPITANDDLLYTGLTYTQGGYSDTSLSGLSNNTIYIIGVPNTNYGELIDGKNIKVSLTTTGGTYNLYSTFQKTGQNLSTQDNKYSDDTLESQVFGDNTTFLFSDEIKKPNGNTSLSWSSGFNKSKPFTQNRKEQYNLQTNVNISQSADTIVGITYLDRGFIVVTNQNIINEGIIASATTLTVNSQSTLVSQSITCIANRGEFGTSTNKTFSTGDITRITEIGLYDTENDLIAIAKSDRQILKNVNDFLALAIKIVI